ncbi:MAG: phospholipid carrier-dependent glycosyltransferase [Anaerolineae bacterium]
MPDNIVNLSLDSEPMQVYATAPLMWLATKLQGVGLIHAAWLLNVLVTALTAVMVYFYGRQLRYADNVSLLTALLYGLGTYAWVYSQMYFREPLFTLFALFCAYGLERWRRQLELRRFNLIWLILALLALAGAWLTKEAGILLIPTLLLVLLPALRWRWLALLVIIGGVLIGGALLYARLFPSLRLASAINNATSIDFTYFPTAVAGYLLSPGFSVWAFSPVLLLGIAGAVLLWRRKWWRQLSIPLVMLLSYVLGYATLRGSDWYSGLGWGARYLLPTIPFLALWLLPMLEYLFTTRRVGIIAVAVGIIAHSIITQVLSVTTPIKAFPNYLYNEGLALGRDVLPWVDGTWNPLYLPHLVTAHQASAPTEIAWMATGAGVVLPLCLALALLSLLALSTTSRRLTISARSFSSGLSTFSKLILLPTLLLTLYLGLRAIYVDPRYGADNPSLWTALDTITNQSRAGDALILDNRTYRPFFMNYYRGDAPIYVLPNPPGEVLEPGKPPDVISDLPEEQAHPYTQIMLARIAKFTGRWWYVTEYTPFSVGRNRATEHYLARHYCAGSTILNLSDLRLIEYSPISAPLDTIPPLPLHRADVDFGAARLIGYDLPVPTAHAGEMLPVSLLWKHEGWAQGIEPFDYSINVSLIDAQGKSWAQRAEAPLGSFGQMSTWQVGGYYRDNVALALPDDLPVGKYDLWVLIFDWRDNHSLRDPYVLTTITIE